MQERIQQIHRTLPGNTDTVWEEDLTIQIKHASPLQKEKVWEAKTVRVGFSSPDCSIELEESR